MWPLQYCEEMSFTLSSPKCCSWTLWPACHGVSHGVRSSHQGTWREFSLLFLRMLSRQMAGPREVPNGDGNISLAKGPQLHWFLLKPEKETTVDQQRRQMRASYQHTFLFARLQTTLTAILLKWDFTVLGVCSFRGAQDLDLILVFRRLETKWAAPVT